MNKLLAHVEANRSNHGYVKHSFEQYKRYNNKMVQKCMKDGSDTTLYKLEKNLCKFHLFGTTRHLTKCINILKKAEQTDDVTAYRMYIQTFIRNKRNEFNQDEFIETWKMINNGFYYTFNSDMVALNENRVNLDKLKTRLLWNDIELLFDSQTHLNLLKQFNKRVLKDDYRFNAQIAFKCFKFDEFREKLDTFPTAQYGTILTFVRSFSIFTNEFVAFLDDNFVSSEFVVEYDRSLTNLLNQMTEALMKPNSKMCLELNETKFSSHFIELITDQSQHIIRSKSDMIKLILAEFDRITEVTVPKRNMPLLPIFYDLACEYIEFPPVDELAEQVDALKLTRQQ
ncbi:hypothetical protein ECANGB1_307 [Enterospora canceri]|uniref:Uncharacterized protein n=1 Tax=Enterospora canceri TaxID=1081671 RepID=A0A1Y1S839_9MICR|nr:hypothetical protein ECANGB1_307 [Enterospora canceri]